MRTVAVALASLAILAVAAWHAGGSDLYDVLTWH